MPNNEIVTTKKGSLASQHDVTMERLSGILSKFEEMEGVLAEEMDVVHQEEAAIRALVLELMAYAKLPYAKERGFISKSTFSKGTFFKKKQKTRDITYLHTGVHRGQFFQDREDTLNDGIDRVAWSDDGEIFIRRQFNSIRRGERHHLSSEIDFDMNGKPDRSRLRQWIKLEDAFSQWGEFDIEPLIKAMQLAIPECERRINSKKAEIERRRSTATSAGRRA